jgi:stage V sporulation protein B
MSAIESTAAEKAGSSGGAAPASANTNADVARTAGRGGLAVAFAKVYFIVVGLVQQVALKAVLGLDGYGALSSVLSIAGITYNPIVSTSIQGVSRAVAQSADAEQPFVVRRVLGVHAVLAITVAVGFFLLSPLIGNGVGAPHIIPGLRILSAVMLLYGLYTPLVGVLNGKKKFVHQAALDILAATLRTFGLIFGGYLLMRQSGRGVEGASLGFVAGATCVLGVALLLVGVGKQGRGGSTVGQHVAFIAPLLFGQVVLNLLLQADLTMLRMFAADSAERAGLPLVAADPLVGAYRATQLFSFLPYQLLLAVTFILFPMLASAQRDGDREAVARYVRAGVRLALVVAGAMVSVTAGLSGPLLTLVFGADVAALGTRSMRILALGFGTFAILGILTTVLNSLKRERDSAKITAGAFGLVVFLCVLEVRGRSFGADLLFRTALATSAGLVVATASAAILVWRTTGAVVAPLSALRALGSMGVAIGVAHVLPAIGASSKVRYALFVVLYAAVVVSVYALLLLVSRELGKADLDNLRAVVSRRRGKR